MEVEDEGVKDERGMLLTSHVLSNAGSRAGFGMCGRYKEQQIEIYCVVPKEFRMHLHD